MVTRRVTRIKDSLTPDLCPAIDIQADEQISLCEVNRANSPKRSSITYDPVTRTATIQVTGAAVAESFILSIEYGPCRLRAPGT